MDDLLDMQKKMATMQARLTRLEDEARDLIAAAEAGEDLRPRLRGLAQIVNRRPAWSTTQIEAAIHEWAQTYGEPPTTADWNPAKAAREMTGEALDEVMERWYGGDWPNTSTVARKFGSFNAAIDSAGFEPREPGANEHSGKNGGHAMSADRLPPWLGWQHLSAYRSRKGMTQQDLARASGVSLIHIGGIERGEGPPNPGIRYLLALSRGLELPPAALVE